MFKLLRSGFRLLVAHHFWGSAVIVLFALIAMSAQIGDRKNFANSELYQDVIDRWGVPIEQPGPTVRYVASGSVFSTLSQLVIASQKVTIDTVMNYRRRGLTYFSGFDFHFQGKYLVKNEQGQSIDIVFVLPINVEHRQMLLSDLTFTVDGKETGVELGEGADKLVWTGRLPKGAEALFDVRFRGRGLSSLLYKLDPALPVKDLDLTINVSGGDNYDYPKQAIPANVVQHGKDSLSFSWKYSSLEAGLPMGVVLPSEKAFDEIIATILRRAWAPFFLFLAGLALLSAYLRKPLQIYQTYLVSVGYAFFFILLAYLSAFMSFYLAFAAAAAAIGPLIFFYLRQALSREAELYLAVLLVAFLFVPTLAVALQGYTGLIYSLEVLGGIAALMWLSSRAEFQTAFEHLSARGEPA